MTVTDSAGTGSATGSGIAASTDANVSSVNTNGAATVPAPDLEIDATGLTCPLPILRAKKALATLLSGQVLKVLTTDRNAIRDFQAFARQTGNVLLLQQENAGQSVHYLRRR